ncbi:MAG: hypothetical protein IKN86_00170 [Bacteroidaceae bacterium]|nr:hypothetical protein [Bacteroidaceae bacterium]
MTRQAFEHIAHELRPRLKDIGRRFFGDEDTEVDKGLVPVILGNRLVMYSESGVYEVSKAELVAKSTTGIRSVASDQKESPIYDLQGRKVVEPQHGIYIKNGRIILK